MEGPRLALVCLMCVLLLNQKIISGEEVEMKVRPGDNITLYCDRSLTTSYEIRWIRNCSHKNQPSLVIDYWKLDIIEHFSFINNPVNNSHDLRITNISVSDLGLYYCAEVEKKVNKNKKGALFDSTMYYYGNRTTRLSFAETSCSGPSTHPASCAVWWSVCPVCVLLISICVYFLYHKNSTGPARVQKDNPKSRNIMEENDEGEVCYASVEVMTRRQNLHKKIREQSSDLSTYAQVRTKTECIRKLP